MIPFEYVRASYTTNSNRCSCQKQRLHMFIAGGTNLVDLMKRGVTTLKRLIDINRPPIKGNNSKPQGSISIGALALNSEVAMNIHWFYKTAPYYQWPLMPALRHS